MSMVFVVIPVVMSYPLLASAAAAVASLTGLKMMEQSAESLRTLAGQEKACATLELDTSAEVRDNLEVQGGFTLEKEGLAFNFLKTRDTGKVKIIISGNLGGYSREELQASARELMNQIMQRYAYDRVMRELNREGFKVLEEERAADSSLRLKVRKWGD